MKAEVVRQRIRIRRWAEVEEKLTEKEGEVVLDKKGNCYGVAGSENIFQL